MSLKLLIVLLALCALSLACANLPRDAEGTLQRVQSSRRLRVGLVEHAPWVIRTQGDPQGAEVELARRFASELNATPEWHWGGEQQQMEALEHFELDLVIGGFTDNTAWSKYVGLTSPYFEEHIIVGVPPSTSPPDNIKGLRIYTKSGETTAAYLKRKGAVPVEVEDVSQTGGTVAAPEWKLEQLGIAGTKIVLSTEKHVMAVAPGENGFLKRLEEFLARERAEVKNLLKQSEAAR